jgi:hypothetical protein
VLVDERLFCDVNHRIPRRRRLQLPQCAIAQLEPSRRRALYSVGHPHDNFARYWGDRLTTAMSRLFEPLVAENRILRLRFSCQGMTLAVPYAATTTSERGFSRWLLAASFGSELVAFWSDY